MGEEDWKKEFSREELEAMGEEPLEGQEQEQKADEETKGPGTQEGEKEASEAELKASESESEQGEDQGEKKEGEETKDSDEEEMPKEGEPVPYDRFAKVYGRAKQTEREREEFKEKLDLFKRSPDEYFEKYPDEKPEGHKAAEDERGAHKAEDIPKVFSMAQLIEQGARIEDPENPQIHGKTLEELLKGDPIEQAAAYDYYRDYVDDAKEKAREAKDKEAESLQAMKEEDNRFMDGQARELFKKPMGELDEVQKDKIESIVNETLAWMKKNHKMAYSLQDAFKIMNYDKALSAASANGAKGLVDFAKTGTVKSVPTGVSEKSTDPYAPYLSMTEEELTEKIGNMPDAKYTEFLANATPAFRQKFPSLPYLN